MNAYIGSVQKRGNWFYLVLRVNGSQKWIALKTGKLRLARTRAAKIAPRDPDNEIAWLEQLVSAGESARRHLALDRARRELNWENLAGWCESSVDARSSNENRSCHERWLGLLGNAVKSSSPDTLPGMVDAAVARAAMETLAGEYLSAPRMVGYFRMVWSAMGLDADVWPRRAEVGAMCQARGSERYRRLTAEEIVIVWRYLEENELELAEMIKIGYFTGLRLSDVAELELSEVELPFLRICPNKTRHHKPNRLKIPLVGSALEVVARLKQATEKTGGRYLFSDRARHRPSRRISRAFRVCGVCKLDGGRASFHSLRATFVSLMDDAGVPPHITDSITGHGGGGMHARYTQPADEALVTAVSKAIPDIFNGGEMQP